MSNYISAKQFLSLDKKVQDSIIKWWEPKIGDLCLYTLYSKMGCVITKGNNGFYIDEVVQWKKIYFIPLLSETQLRNYIEYKIKDGVCINCSEDGYTLKVETDKGWFVASSEDLMECYLEIAVKVS
jgi:hypothetical protein